MKLVTRQAPVWALIVSLAISPLLAFAQEFNLNPGLWELKTSLTSPNKPDRSATLSKMREAFKNMPQETRRLLEQKMGTQGLAFGDDDEIRVCFTAEEVRRHQIFPGKSGKMAEGCSYSDLVKTGNSVKGRLSCVNPQMTGDFQAQISPTHYTTEANVLAAESGRLHMKTDARWLGKDCGALAPVPETPR